MTVWESALAAAGKHRTAYRVMGDAAAAAELFGQSSKLCGTVHSRVPTWKFPTTELCCTLGHCCASTKFLCCFGSRRFFCYSVPRVPLFTSIHAWSPLINIPQRKKHVRGIIPTLVWILASSHVWPIRSIFLVTSKTFQLSNFKIQLVAHLHQPAGPDHESLSWNRVCWRWCNMSATRTWIKPSSPPTS
jgi:hypothetical protein